MKVSTGETGETHPETLVAAGARVLRRAVQAGRRSQAVVPAHPEFPPAGGVGASKGVSPAHCRDVGETKRGTGDKRLTAAAAVVVAVAAAPAAAVTTDDLRRQLALERRQHAAALERARAARTTATDVAAALKVAAVVYGIPLRQLTGVARCESTLNPHAVNGRYRGLFQQGPMFEATPFGRAGLSVWNPYAAALSTAYTVRREGWKQWSCAWAAWR